MELEFREGREPREEHEHRLEELRRRIAEDAGGGGAGRSGSGATLASLVLVPLGVAAVCAAIVGLFFWATHQERKSTSEWLDRVRSRHGYERKWALVNLTAMLRSDEEARQTPQVAMGLAAFFGELGGAQDEESLTLKKYVLCALALLKRPEVVPQVERWLETESDLGVRAYCLQALGRIGDASAAPAMVRYLMHPEPILRRFAAKNIAALGRKEDVDAIAALLDDPAEDVRWNAATGLAFYHSDGRGVEVLARMLDRQHVWRHTWAEDGRQRLQLAATTIITACQAAGRLGDPALAPALERLARNDPEIEVRRAADEALRQIRREDS